MTPGRFEGLVGSTFNVAGTTLRLEALRRLPPHPYRDEPFALEFTGPLDSAIGQGTYGLVADDGGEFEMFLVPNGPSGGVMRYEATFN